MNKRVPLRQCVGCREMKEKRELIRVVHAPDGTISLDDKGKMNGRGAYVCRCRDCLEKAIKNKGLERAFKEAIPASVYDRLLKESETFEQ